MPYWTCFCYALKINDTRKEFRWMTRMFDFMQLYSGIVFPKTFVNEILCNNHLYILLNRFHMKLFWLSWFFQLWMNLVLKYFLTNILLRKKYVGNELKYFRNLIVFEIQFLLIVQFLSQIIRTIIVFNFREKKYDELKSCHFFSATLNLPNTQVKFNLERLSITCNKTREGNWVEIRYKHLLLTILLFIGKYNEKVTQFIVCKLAFLLLPLPFFHFNDFFYFSKRLKIVVIDRIPVE